MNMIRRYRRNPIAIGVAILVLIGLLFSALWIMIPPPPKKIEIATGFPTGLYYHFGERLKQELAKESVELKVRSTGGTLDNLKLLSDPKSKVDFALIQGGVADVAHYPHLVSIAGMFYEPMWVWYRPSSFAQEKGELSVLSQLKGKRVSIGNIGSGTLVLSNALLHEGGLEKSDFHAEMLNPEKALEQFKRGELDVVMLVSAAEAPLLQEFYKVPGIRLMSFDQAEAYSRHLPYLARVNVPRGLLSIEHDLPSRDITVLAPTATLVGHDDMSPALVTLLLSNTYDILKTYSHLQKAHQFPSGENLDFPLQADAEIYLNDGPSFLHRHLPFWTAVWVGRFVKIVIPLLVILIPVFTYVPAIKNFALRLKLSRVYEELKAVEKNASNLNMEIENYQKIADIERRVDNIKVSALDAKELYDLKGHVANVRVRLNLYSAANQTPAMFKNDE